MANGKDKKVTKKEDRAIMAVEMDVFSDSGFEGTTSESYMIPMMKVVQALSPVKKRTDASYNPEAEDGDFYNSALNKLSKELNVRVLSIDHQLVVWTPRSMGGGFVGSHHKTEEKEVVFRRDGVKKWDKDGNEVMDTLMLTCMDADNPTDLFFFPLSSSSLKSGKSWLSKMKAVKVNPKTMKLDAEGQAGLASWAVVWNVKTVLESNDQGEWYTIGNTPSAIRTFEEVDMTIIQDALAMVKKSKLDYDNMDNSGDGSSATSEEF